MDNSLGIPWIDFATKLKMLSPKLEIALNFPVPHPEYPELTLLGIKYGNKHICSVTFCEVVPYRDVVDEKGIITHRGIKTILQYLLKAEWVPYKNSTLNMPKRYQGEHFLPEINLDKIKSVFSTTFLQVLHG